MALQNTQSVLSPSRHLLADVQVAGPDDGPTKRSADSSARNDTYACRRARAAAACIASSVPAVYYTMCTSRIRAGTAQYPDWLLKLDAREAADDAREHRAASGVVAIIAGIARTTDRAVARADARCTLVQRNDRSNCGLPCVIDSLPFVDLRRFARCP